MMEVLRVPSSMSSGLDDKIKAMSTFAGLEHNTCERYLEESGGDYEGGKSTFSHAALPEHVHDAHALTPLLYKHTS